MTNNYIIDKILKYGDEHNLYITVTEDEQPFIIVEEYDERIERILDRNGIEWGYSDSYTTCDDCYKVIQTEPTSYHWRPDYYRGDGFIVCNDCFTNSDDLKEEYINERINNPSNANELLSYRDLIYDFDFEKINDWTYENGWHRGQDDDPKKIYEELKDQYNEILFTISARSQFFISFDVYGRNRKGEDIC